MAQSRGVLSAMGSGVLLRIAGAAVNLLIVPIAIHNLGQERYGNLAALLGIAGWLMIGNLGLGNAVAMSLAGLHDRENEARIVFWRAVISACIVIGIALAVAAGPFVFLVRGLAANSPVPQQQELYWAGLYCFFAFAICAIGTPFEGRYFGKLQTAYSNFTRLTWQLISISVLLAMASVLDSVLALCVVMTLAPMGSALWFIGKGIIEYPPPRGFKFRIRDGTSLVGQGLGFLGSSIAIMFHGGGYLPLFAMAFGKDQLATAGVLSRMTQMYCSFIAVLLLPLGFGLRHAISSGDLRWVRKSLSLALIVLLGAAAGAAVVLIFWGEFIVSKWSGTDLPGLREWLAPEALLLGVISWSYVWVFVSFAMHGSLIVAVLAIAEIILISAIYYVAGGSWLSPSHSLYVSALVMLLLSGTVLPCRVLMSFAFGARGK